jgi:hypothetical protein
VVVGIPVVVHAIQRFECEWTSTVTLAWRAPSLVVQVSSSIEGPLTSFLWEWPKILFLVVQRPTAIGIDVVYLLGVTTLVVVLAGWS